MSPTPSITEMAENRQSASVVLPPNLGDLSIYPGERGQSGHPLHHHLQYGAVRRRAAASPSRQHAERSTNDRRSSWKGRPQTISNPSCNWPPLDIAHERGEAAIHTINRDSQKGAENTPTSLCARPPAYAPPRRGGLSKFDTRIKYPLVLS